MWRACTDESECCIPVGDNGARRKTRAESKLKLGRNGISPYSSHSVQAVHVLVFSFWLAFIIIQYPFQILKVNKRPAFDPFFKSC